MSNFMLSPNDLVVTPKTIKKQSQFDFQNGSINYISRLNEWTQTNKLQVPQYVFSENKSGVPHLPVFFCTVYIENRYQLTCSTGFSTKKAAKHAAAKEIFLHILSQHNLDFIYV